MTTVTVVKVVRGKACLVNVYATKKAAIHAVLRTCPDIEWKDGWKRYGEYGDIKVSIDSKQVPESKRPMECNALRWAMRDDWTEFEW